MSRYYPILDPDAELARLRHERDRAERDRDEAQDALALVEAQRDFATETASKARSDRARYREAIEAHRERCYTQDEDGKWLAVDGADAILYQALAGQEGQADSWRRHSPAKGASESLAGSTPAPSATDQGQEPR